MAGTIAGYSYAWGIISGPFLGTFLGELLAGNNSMHALRADLGALMGFIMGLF